MTARPLIAFHVDLVQDVAVLRPLLRLARTMDHADLLLMVGRRFADLDQTGLWRAEVEEIAGGLGIPAHVHRSEREAIERLAGRRGLLIAGSESSLSNHMPTHRLMTTLPPQITAVTLQHGVECIGFLHNERHDATAGRDVRFAAEVLAGWFAADRLTAMPARERGKLVVTGPPMLIDPRPDVAAPRDPARRAEGIVCENLHSVRFSGAGLRRGFLDVFTDFAARMAQAGHRIHLRPHPAGRFTERNAVTLPKGVTPSRAPIYKEDIARFDYGLSAPSSVLLDFVVAGVPAAVWVDEEGAVDARNFAGLPTVSDADDWAAFAHAAVERRADLIAAQEAWLAGLGIPADVPARYRALLAMAG